MCARKFPGTNLAPSESLEIGTLGVKVHFRRRSCLVSRLINRNDATGWVVLARPASGNPGSFACYGPCIGPRPARASYTLRDALGRAETAAGQGRAQRPLSFRASQGVLPQAQASVGASPARGGLQARVQPSSPGPGPATSALPEAGGQPDGPRAGHPRQPSHGGRGFRTFRTTPRRGVRAPCPERADRSGGDSSLQTRAMTSCTPLPAPVAPSGRDPAAPRRRLRCQTRGLPLPAQSLARDSGMGEGVQTALVGRMQMRPHRGIALLT